MLTNKTSESDVFLSSHEAKRGRVPVILEIEEKGCGANTDQRYFFVSKMLKIPRVILLVSPNRLSQTCLPEK